MNLEDLLKSVKRSNRTKVIVGVFVAALGIFMIALGVATDDAYGDLNEGGIVLAWLFSLLFIGTGVLMIVLSVKSNRSIASRQHPFLRAMDNPNDLAVIWVYEHIVKSSATANHSLPPGAQGDCLRQGMHEIISHENHFSSSIAA